MSGGSTGQVTGLFSPWLERQRLRKVAAHVNAGDSVLDIGCGRARILRHIPAPKRYVGVDVLGAVVEENRRAWASHEFYVYDIEGDSPAPFGQGEFDVIVMGAVMEHFRDPVKALGRLKGFLRPGGRIILTTPSPAGRLVMKAGAATGLMSREAESEHETLLGRDDLEAIAGACGMRLAHYGRFLYGFNQIAVLA